MADSIDPKGARRGGYRGFKQRPMVPQHSNTMRPTKQQISHPKHPEPRLPLDPHLRRPQRLPQHIPRMARRNHPIIPQPGTPKNRRTLPLDPLRQPDIHPLPHRRHHTPQLLTPHHPDAGIRPAPQEPGPVRPPAHAVVAGPETAPDEDGEFGHGGAGDGRDELGAVLGDARVLGFAADHEARDVLEEEERDGALGAELDEVGAFEGGGGEEDAVVGEDADGVVVDACEACWGERTNVCEP